jgi:hypothetical protein
MPILYLKNNATTAKSVRPTGYTFPTGLNQVFSSNTATDYLVIAGGGGGADGNAGAGGAGGYLTGTSTLDVSTPYTVSVGGGGPNAANGTSLTYTNSPNAIATSSTGSGGSGNVGGANTTVQFNDSGVLQGVAGFTFNKTTNILTVSTGSVNTASINATTSVTAPVLVSNVSTGTQPITVSSTTRVANLNVSYANVSDYGVVTNQTTGTYYPVFVSSNATGNYAHAANGASIDASFHLP